MRKWTKLLATAAALAAVAAIAAIVARQTEPQYKGHPLSYWVAISTAGGTNSAAAREAISAIGTNAIPLLLKWTHYEYRPLLVDRLPARTPLRLRRFIRELTISKSEILAPSVASGFACLGTDAAAPAVPALAAMLYDTNAPNTAIRAINILLYLGTNAQTTVLSAIEDPQYPFRSQALGRLMVDYRIHLGELRPVIGPVLLRCLSNTNEPPVPFFAAECLGYYQPAPDLSVPALARCLADPSVNDAVRLAAIGALGSFRYQAGDALPTLSNLLSHPSSGINQAAAEAIQKIASDLAQ